MNTVPKLNEIRFDRLLASHDFILLYVPKADERGKMRMVRPALDSKIQEEFRTWSVVNGCKRQLPYCTISHLWDIPNEEREQHMWDEIGDYLDDEHGRPIAPIPMRAEKRQTLLSLVRARPDSYWWIDVLCYSRTPPTIMKDIYWHCYECFSMLDGVDEQDIVAISGNQLERMSSRLNTLSHDQSSELIMSHGLFDIWSTEWQQIEKVFNARWWDRVWTLQEMILPPSVKLIPETTRNSDIQHWVNVKTLSSFLSTVHVNYHHKQDFYSICHKMTSPRLRSMWNISAGNVHSLVRKRLLGLGITENHSIELLSLLEYLARCPRRCFKPVDYVYGVLVFFDYDFPRMKDPRAVWQTFLVKLVEDIEDNPLPCGQHLSLTSKVMKVDLTTAQCLSDVFSGIVEVMYPDGTSRTIGT